MKLNLSADAQAGPIYLQVKNCLEQMISSGQLKKGETLPKAAEVAKTNNIPEAEVIRAYYELVLANLLRKTQRKNLFGDTIVEYSVE
ncbi:MAG: GntR family transcriptional regulator [Acidobacteriota bacterium]|nr:GntR family transcriptional regulator [Blastocatellia bacterium]MDW8411425.1 GntR family transcriptional regulator [Acidobacteriota bacterium]